MEYYSGQGLSLDGENGAMKTFSDLQKEKDRLDIDARARASEGR